MNEKKEIKFKQVDARWMYAVLNSGLSFSESKCDLCGRDLPFEEEFRVIAVNTSMNTSYALGKVHQACLDKICVEKFHWNPQEASSSFVTEKKNEGKQQ